MPEKCVLTATANKVISRHRKNENVFKMSKDKTCTCKACKNTIFHCQICKFVGFSLPNLASREELIVFSQIWKPQFLSVVQFPFDNCHSPFSPTTFFEIGVYRNWYYIWVELSGWMGSVSYGLGADLSLPPCLSVTIGIWTLLHKTDPRAEISGEIVQYDALAPRPEVQFSWCFVCACAGSLKL